MVLISLRACVGRGNVSTHTHTHACLSVEDQIYFSEPLLMPLEKQLSQIIDLFWRSSCVSFIYMKVESGKRKCHWPQFCEGLFMQKIHTGDLAASLMICFSQYSETCMY